LKINKITLNRSLNIKRKSLKARELLSDKKEQNYKETISECKA